MLSVFYPARLEYCSAVGCSAADTHLKLLDCACSQWSPVSNWGCVWVTLLIVDPWQYCACCITSGVTRCILLMVLYLDRMCQCGLITRGALVAHRDTYTPPRCRTTQYSRTFILLSVSLLKDFVDPVFDGVGLEGIKMRANAFNWTKLLYPYSSLLLFFTFSSFCL